MGFFNGLLSVHDVVFNISDGSEFLPLPPTKTKKICENPNGTKFSDGDSWRVSACQSCMCRAGQIHCFSQTCPLLACNKTILKKGQCCPYCLG